MTLSTCPSGYRVITAAEAQERFSVSAHLDYPYQEFADEQEIRLYDGGLDVSGNLEPDGDVDWIPYNVIVDGDLTVGGNLEWWDYSAGNFLLVTGNVRARNVLLSGCPSVVIHGDLTTTGGIQGHHGDDGGSLTVHGHVRADIIISTLYFNLRFARKPEALLIADPHRTNCAVDLTDDDLDDMVLPQLLDEHGRADEYNIGTALRAGQQVLRHSTRAK
jgi:hypothetical protein